MPGTTTLLEALQNVIDVTFEDIHTALPGRFESYDYTKQKASVKPLIKKVYLDDEVLDLPVIASVPVVFPRTTTSGVTFPINKNDKCLLIFSERSLQNWALSGRDSSPGDPRRYALTDAVAIPGLFSFAETNLASNNTDLEIHHKGFKIVITPEGKFKLVGKNGIELIKVIDDWMTQVKQNKVITGIGLQPFDPTSIAAMTVIQNQLKELLT